MSIPAALKAPRSREDLALALGIYGGALILLALVFARNGIPWWIPPGTLPALGIPSPLSGMTRSFVALASGDVSSSFAWHPLGPLVFVACAASVLIAAATIRTGRVPRAITERRPARALWMGVAGAFAAAWIRQLLVLG